MAEEITIKVRTEVEGTEELGQYRSEMSKVQTQTDKATKSAAQVGRRFSDTASQFSQVTKSLGTISPTLGKITKSFNTLTSSLNKFRTTLKATKKDRQGSDMTDTGNGLGNAKTAKAGRASTMAKVAGAGLAIGAAAQLFNAITGTGSKLAAFDKLNTLGSPSVLDPLIPYLKRAEKTAENIEGEVGAISNKITPTEGPSNAYNAPLAVPVSESVKQTQELFESEAEKIVNTNKRTLKIPTAPVTIEDTTPEPTPTPAAPETPTTEKSKIRLLYDSFIEKATEYAEKQAEATTTVSEPVKEKEWWEHITDFGGEIAQGITDGIDSKVKQVQNTWDKVLSGDIVGAFVDNSGAYNIAEKNKELATQAIPGASLAEKVATGQGVSALDVAFTGVDALLTFLPGGKALSTALKSAGKAAEATTTTLKATTKATEEATMATSKATTTAVKEVGGASRQVMLEVVDVADNAIGGATSATSGLLDTITGFTTKLKNFADDTVSKIQNATKKVAGESYYDDVEGEFVIPAKAAKEAGITIEKTQPKVITVDDVMKKAEATKTATETTTTAKKLSDKIKNVATTVAKYGALGGIMSIGGNLVSGLLNTLGFAEGGVFEPNKPQLAILGDHRSQKEVAAPYNMIVDAVSEALRNNESRGAPSYESGPTSIEIPLSLNGKVIARTIFDDLENEKRRRNGSAVI